MATIAAFRKLDQEHAALTLREAGEKLDGTDREMVLDLSELRRIDSATLRALEDFIRIADEKSVRVVLSSVNLDVYKVLKLVKLTSRFGWVN